MFFSSVVVKDGGYNDDSNKYENKNGDGNYSVDNLLCVTEHNIPIRMNAYKIKFNGLLIKPNSFTPLITSKLKTYVKRPLKKNVVPKKIKIPEQIQKYWFLKIEPSSSTSKLNSMYVQRTLSRIASISMFNPGNPVK